MKVYFMFLYMPSPCLLGALLCLIFVPQSRTQVNGGVTTWNIVNHCSREKEGSGRSLGLKWAHVTSNNSTQVQQVRKCNLTLCPKVREPEIFGE